MPNDCQAEAQTALERDARKVLAAKTPEAACKAFAEFLKTHYQQKVLEPGQYWGTLVVRSPEETKRFGFGSGWSVCWEEGPFGWALCASEGGSLFDAEFGTFSKGPFPDGLDNDKWYSSPYNGFVLNFYPV